LNAPGRGALAPPAPEAEAGGPSEVRVPAAIGALTALENRLTLTLPGDYQGRRKPGEGGIDSTPGGGR
jgi:hypothetical protein